MMKRIVTGSLGAVLVIAAMSGCAPAVKEPFVVWPIAPETPRVKYIKTHYGKQDFQEFSILDIFIGASPEERMVAPFGIDVVDNVMYITQSKRAAVLVMDPQNKKASIVGQGKGLRMPLGIAVSRNGIMYIADPKANKVLAIDRNTETVFNVGGKDAFVRPVAVALNEKLERLYVADIKANQVKVFSLKGEFLFAFGRQGSKDGEFHGPIGVAIDRKSGNVVIADSLNYRAQVFDKDGKFISKFGSVGDREGLFGRPKSVAVDSESNIYVVDSMFNNFQMFNKEGQVLLVVGSGGKSGGQFINPSDICIDENDRVYVVDWGNNRVQELQYLSERWIKEHPEEFKQIDEQSMAAIAGAQGKTETEPASK